MKPKIPKLSNEVLRSIWEASRHTVEKNKKKYTRKNKHKKMSDSIKKWHEMQEDKHLREKAEIKKKAYRLLTEYDAETIRVASRILNEKE